MRINQPGNISLANFICEVSSVGDIHGTVSEQPITKDQFNTFQDNMTQYLLCEFDNQRLTIIIVQDIKDPYAHIDTDNPKMISKEDTEDVILITKLQEEVK